MTRIASVVALLLAVPVCAQDAALTRQVEFIRALARDLGFINLAQEEVDRLMKDKKAADATKQIAQLGIEISLFGAKGTRNDREAQRRLFKDALDRSKEFIDRYRGDPVALPAQITLGDACFEFGRFLADEVEIARADAPDRVKELEEQATAVFQLGKDTCDEVMAALGAAAASDGEAKFKRAIAWLRKGVLLREHARAVKKDRDYLASAAKTALEDLAMEMGEETILGMRAMFERSQVDEVIGKLDEASSNYTDTIDAIYTALTEQELPPSSRELLGSMLQEAYEHLTTTQLLQGKSDEVLAAIKDFDERLKKLDAEEDPRFGHSVRLNQARALAETGDKTKVSQALQLATKINADHPADLIGLKAKTLLRDILSMQASLVSADLLYQVALGDYQSKRYEQAVQGFKRAIGAMTAEDGAKIGMPAHLNLARCFMSQTRPIEAMFALRAGISGYPQGEGASDASRLMEIAIRQVRSLTKNDASLDTFVTDATRLAASVGGARTQDKVNWDAAATNMSQNKFAEAATAFAQVSADSPYYELALVRQVQAWKAAKQVDKALAAAAAYKKWRDGDGAAAKNTTNRPQAEAELEFHTADLLFQQANGDIGGKKDPAKFNEVVAKLSDYAARHGKAAPALEQAAYDLLARSHTEIGQRDKAEEAYRNLRKIAPDNSRVPKLATVIFSAHHENVKALDLELQAAIKANSPNVAQTAKSLDAARKATVAFGLDYLRSSPSPQYPILFLSMQNADELKDWNAAQEFANKLVDAFGNDPQQKNKVDTFVRPVLGKILLRQSKFREAYDMLVAAEKQLDAGGQLRAASYPVKQLLCQALGGWREIDNKGDAVTFTGLGRANEAYDKYWGEVKRFALSQQRGVTDYSLEWYAFHWEAYWYALQASQKDTKYRRYAETLYNLSRATDNFESLKKLGPKGEELFTLFQKTPLR